MIDQEVKPLKKRYHTKLYSDFINHDPLIKTYLFSSNPVEIADKIGPPKIDRDILCDILDRQNKRFQAKPKTFGAIEGLRQKDALCCFAGQQAGLFGGPLLTLYKAIDIVKRARKLEKELVRPVVPIFWIASDDHDFAEINHTYFINKDGKLNSISYQYPEDIPVPVANIRLDDEGEYIRLKEQARAAYGETDFSDELIRRIFAAYTSEKSITDAFAEYMTDILPDLGLVFFCPVDNEIKQLSKDFFKRLIESHFRFKQTLNETCRYLKDDNYHIQAEKKQSAVHLFYNDPERLAIHFLDESFHFGETRIGLSGMLDLIERHPEKFSPDVLARPLWQSYLFPVVAQTGGPSEIAYFCQIGKLFRLFDLAQPYYYPRAGATIIDKRAEELFKKYDFGFTDLIGDIEQLVNRVAEQSFPKEIEEKIENFRKMFDDEFSRFENEMIVYEKELEPIAKQTYGKIDLTLNNFEKKIYSQNKKSMQAVRSRLYRLAEVLYPNRNLQERYLNINYFISKYGFDIVNHISGNLDVDTVDNQMIYISEFTK